MRNNLKKKRTRGEERKRPVEMFRSGFSALRDDIIRGRVSRVISRVIIKRAVEFHEATRARLAANRRRRRIHTVYISNADVKIQRQAAGELYFGRACDLMVARVASSRDASRRRCTRPTVVQINYRCYY